MGFSMKIKNVTWLAFLVAAINSPSYGSAPDFSPDFVFNRTHGMYVKRVGDREVEELKELERIRQKQTRVIASIRQMWASSDRQGILELYIQPEIRDVVREALRWCISQDEQQRDSSLSKKFGTLKLGEQPDMHQQIEAVLKEFNEGFAIPSTLFLNLRIHKVLAEACKRKIAGADKLFSDLLNFFSLDPNDFLAHGSVYFLKKSESETVREDLSSNASAQDSAAFSLYKQAQEMESRGDERSLEFYEQAFIKGYEPALVSLARLAEDDFQAYETYLASGKRGFAEGYFEIAKMVRDGFRPFGDGDRAENNAAFWFEKALGVDYEVSSPISEDFSASSAIALAQLYEREQKISSAIRIYKMLAKRGYILGYLEEGQLLENQGDFEAAKAIYQQEEAGWLGLSALEKIATTDFEIECLRRNQNALFQEHFQKLIALAKSEEK